MHRSDPAHARHDTSLIAAHAAGDTTDTAAALLATCAACAQLHRDLVAIASATRTLPHSIPGPRDFRLTIEQAARLRRHSWLRTFLRPFGAGASVARLAPALTSAGIAGVLVLAFAPGLLGGIAPAPARDMAADAQAGSGAPAAAPEAAATADAATTAGAGAIGAAGAPTDNTFVRSGDSEGPDVASATGDPNLEIALGKETGAANGGRASAAGTFPTASSSPLFNAWLVASIGLLGVGLLLFGLRLAARRLR